MNQPANSYESVQKGKQTTDMQPHSTPNNSFDLALEPSKVKIYVPFIELIQIPDQKGKVIQLLKCSDTVDLAEDT